jgi:hypothetical protein
MFGTIIALLFAFKGPATTPAILQTPTRDLVTLTMTLDKSVYRRGDPIRVTLVLRTGKRGAFIPDFFSDFKDTCERGFAAALLIKNTNVSAIKDLSGCAASIIHSGPGIDTPQKEFRHFAHLLPGETKSWTTTLRSTVDHPGEYEVVGEYLSFAYMIDEVGQLPEVHGTMVHGRISADTQKVRIK